MATKRSLKVLDRLAEERRTAFTTAEVRSALKLSHQATSNLLSGLTVEGLVNRVAGGRYVLRPIGALGTPRADPAAITRPGLAPALVLRAEGTAHGNADELWRTSAAGGGSSTSDLSSKRTSTDTREQTLPNYKTAITGWITGVASS